MNNFSPEPWKPDTVMSGRARGAYWKADTLMKLRPDILTAEI